MDQFIKTRQVNLILAYNMFKDNEKIFVKRKLTQKRALEIIANNEEGRKDKRVFALFTQEAS